MKRRRQPQDQRVKFTQNNQNATPTTDSAKTTPETIEMSKEQPEKPAVLKNVAGGMAGGIVASVLIGSAMLGYQWWTAAPEPSPKPEKVVLSPEDCKATQNNRTCDAETVAMLVALANKGNGVFVLEGFPPGEAKEVRTITVIGGVDPSPPVPPGPEPKPPTPPNPPNPPKPAPTGFAGDVAAKAKGLPAADCKALASNYEVVSSMIAAGGILKIEDAVTEITKLNKSLGLDKPTWTPFAAWLEFQFNAKGKTLADAKALMDGVVVGLEYIGGQ